MTQKHLRGGSIMATVSFTKEMKLDQKETNKLFEILESESKNNYKITTPAAPKASKKELEAIIKNRKW